MILFDHHAQFITITNLNWLTLLQNDHHKQIIIEAFKTRVNKEQVTIYAFVIMPNHMQPKWKLADFPENYLYSSAAFYETGVDEFGWLTHFRG